MKLPRGVTGFGEPPPELVSDIRAFTTVCHEVARTVGGKVESVQPANAGTPTSFHSAMLVLPSQGRVRVLCNAYAPILAFAHADDSPGTISFIDVPEIAQGWRGYVALSRAEAEAPSDGDTLSLLADVEVKQAKYWKPHCVGEFVFNFWD
jgi:hypothetical protein